MKDATSDPSLFPTASRPPEGELRPAIVQAPDGRVLMLGYMDAPALRHTLETRRVTFYSRSRRRQWTKGETSGHWLEARAVRDDCDGDALLVVARPHGPTCHSGRASCFEAGEVLLEGRLPGASADRDGKGSTELGAALEELWEVIIRRDRERPDDSYTARLLEAGVSRAAQKVGEEGVEVALAARGPAERLAAESADLLYHVLVLWRATGLEPGDVAGDLARRRERRAGGPGRA